MAVQIKIDQASKPAGVAGQAREDLSTGTPVTLAAVGGPFAQYQWTLIDAPPNATLTAASGATLSAPTSPTTQITPDNDGTYLVELAVDAGFGLGARPEDVVRITFYAGVTLNPIIDQLPRRVMSAFERLEHNVPDAIDPGGNVEGWAREWRKWFKVIALAMTSGLNPPSDPADNNKVAFGLNGNLSYADAVQVLNPTAAQDGLSLARVQAAGTDLTLAAGTGVPAAIIFEANAAERARLTQAGVTFAGATTIETTTGTMTFKLQGAPDTFIFDCGTAAGKRVEFSQAAGQGFFLYGTSTTSRFAQMEEDRLLFQTDNGITVGYTTATHTTGPGLKFLLRGQDAFDTPGAVGGPVEISTGSGAPTTSELPGEFRVQIGTVAPSFIVGIDALGNYAQIGSGNLPPKGNIRTPQSFSWYAYGGSPTTGTRILSYDGTNIDIGLDPTDGWPVNSTVWLHASGGARVTDGSSTTAEYLSLRQTLVRFYTDNPVSISRQAHTSGAGTSTTLSGQAAFTGSGLTGGELKLESGPGDAGPSSHGPLTFSVGGIIVAQAFYDSFRIFQSQKLRFNDGSNYITFSSPTLSSNTDYVLPATDGSPNQQLTTDGAGNLSWQSGTVGGVSSVFTRTGAVTAQAGDYGSDLITNDSGTVPGSTVTAAMEDAYHQSVASEIQGTAVKGTPVGADVLLIEDSAASWVKKRITITSLPSSAPVTSVFTRTGAVTAQASDYDASQVDNDSGVAGTYVSDALDTLDSTKAALTSTAPVNVTKLPAAVGVGTTAARHDHKHDVQTGTPLSVQFQTNSEGTAVSLARSDHAHNISSSPPAALSAGGIQVGGTSPSANRADHEHACPVGTPVAISTANSQGSSNLFCHSDHVHDHGNQIIGTHHALANNTTPGFLNTVGANQTVLQSNGTNAYWATNLDLAGSIDMNDNQIFAVRDLTFQTEYNETGTAIPFDVEQFVVKTLTSSPSLTLDTPTGPCHRQLRLVQDGTGSRTVTWTTTIEWAGGSAPTLSTGGGDVDIINFFYNGSTWFGQARLNFD